MPEPLPLVIAIEGNIGVGKSTQIKRLQELFKEDERIVVLPEPVDEWVDKGFLAGMYDGSISKGEFQHMVLMSLAGDLLKALARKPTPAVIITERSPWGTHSNIYSNSAQPLYPPSAHYNTFGHVGTTLACNLANSRLVPVYTGNYHVFGRANLTGKSLELYHHTWERVLGGLPSQLDVKYAYLRAEPATIEARMKTRGREAEALVPREYLETLHRLHDEWMQVTPSVGIFGDGNVEDVWHGLCCNLSRWFAEAGETFKSQRAIRETSEREKNLTVMMICAQDASSLLEEQSPEARARKRQKASEPAGVA
jgi:hypothetical protein